MLICLVDSVEFIVGRYFKLCALVELDAVLLVQLNNIFLQQMPWLRNKMDEIDTLTLSFQFFLMFFV